MTDPLTRRITHSVVLPLQLPIGAIASGGTTHERHYLTADGEHYKTADGMYYQCKQE